MDKEAVIIVTDDNIAEEGDTIDHEYGGNDSEEEKIYGESEVEEGSYDCVDEEGAYVEEEEKQLQEGPDRKKKSFDETAIGRPSIEAEGRGIDRFDPTIGGKSHETKTGTYSVIHKPSDGALVFID